MEWLEIAKYIDTVALITIVFLFVRGYIVSKYTITGREKAYRETLEQICTAHKETIKMITISYEKSVEDLKDVIKIFKEKNGIK